MWLKLFSSLYQENMWLYRKVFCNMTCSTKTFSKHVGRFLRFSQTLLLNVISVCLNKYYCLVCLITIKKRLALCFILSFNVGLVQALKPLPLSLGIRCTDLRVTHGLKPLVWSYLKKTQNCHNLEWAQCAAGDRQRGKNWKNMSYILWPTFDILFRLLIMLLKRLKYKWTAVDSALPSVYKYIPIYYTVLDKSVGVDNGGFLDGFVQ